MRMTAIYYRSVTDHQLVLYIVFLVKLQSTLYVYSLPRFINYLCTLFYKRITQTQGFSKRERDVALIPCMSSPHGQLAAELHAVQCPVAPRCGVSATSSHHTLGRVVKTIGTTPSW